MFKIFQNKYMKISIFLILFGGLLIVRFMLYGNPALSIGGSDTNSFLESSKKPILSLDFFTSRRPATMNLFYKILEPPSGYDYIHEPQRLKNRVKGAENLFYLPGLEPGGPERPD